MNPGNGTAEGKEEGVGPASSSPDRKEEFKSESASRTATIVIRLSGGGSSSGAVNPAPPPDDSQSELSNSASSIKWLIELLESCHSTPLQAEKLRLAKAELENILKKLNALDSTAEDLTRCYRMIKDLKHKEKDLLQEVISEKVKVLQLEDNEKSIVEVYEGQLRSEQEKREEAENELNELKIQLQLLQGLRTTTATAPMEDEEIGIKEEEEDQDQEDQEEEGPPLISIVQRPLTPAAPPVDGVEIKEEEEDQDQEDQGEAEGPPLISIDRQVVGEGEGDPIGLAGPLPPNEAETEDVGQPEGREHGNPQLDILLPVVVLEKYIPPEGPGENRMNVNNNNVNDPSLFVVGSSDPIPPPQQTTSEGYNLRLRSHLGSTLQLQARVPNPSTPINRRSLRVSKTSKAVAATRKRAVAKSVPTRQKKPVKAPLAPATRRAAEPKRHLCTICGMGFTRRGHLEDHIRSRHSKKRPFRCQICRRTFVRKYTLTVHARIHSGEKPYQCRVCRSKFTDSSNLGRHVNSQH